MGNGTTRANVLRAFRAHQVTVFLVPNPEAPNLYSIEKDDFIEQIVLEEFVPMWILNRFKRLLDIPIRHFWNPEEAEKAL